MAQLVITLFIAAYRAASGIAMVEIVPVHIRCSVVALAYAIAASIFGDMTPMIATLLIKTTHSSFSLALGISVCALVSLFAVSKIRETK